VEILIVSFGCSNNPKLFDTFCLFGAILIFFRYLFWQYQQQIWTLLVDFTESSSRFVDDGIRRLNNHKKWWIIG